MCRLRSFSLLVSALVVLALPATAAEPPLRLTVLYDNWMGVEGTEDDWGFAMLVERGDTTVLFDTGRHEGVLEENIEALDIDFGTIDAVVLSHDHDDHTGGLKSVLAHNSNLRVYMPPGCAQSSIKTVEDAGAEAISASEPVQIAPGMWLSGTFGVDISEQSLVIEHGDGLILVTGCAHPGIVAITRSVDERFERTVDTVLGGFHLIREDESGISSVIDALESLGVKRAGPSHCSGKPAVDQFRAAFGPDFIALGTGRVIDLF